MLDVILFRRGLFLFERKGARWPAIRGDRKRGGIGSKRDKKKLFRQIERRTFGYRTNKGNKTPKKDGSENIIIRRTAPSQIPLKFFE